MQSHFTFEQLPEAVTILTNQVNELKLLLLEKKKETPTDLVDEFLTIKEAASLLHLSVPTLYSKHSKGEIPNVSKRGKRLYFSKQSLINWVKEGNQKSKLETVLEVEEYLSYKKGL